MAIRPTTARTHSGTPSTLIFNLKTGELRRLWVSPAGWEFFPIDDVTDNDLAEAGCQVKQYCLGEATAVGFHPDTHDHRTACTVCMQRIVRKAADRGHHDF